MSDEQSQIHLSPTACQRLALELHRATVRTSVLAGLLRDRDLYRATLTLSSAHSGALLCQDLPLRHLRKAIDDADAMYEVHRASGYFEGLFADDGDAPTADRTTEPPPV